jgi:hypothetical protein
MFMFQLSGQTLAKARGLIINHFWARESDKEANAQVKWDIIIQPMSKGGIKILDPQVQCIISQDFD